MPEFLSSKTVVSETPPRTRSTPASAAAIAGIVGTASWGPIGEPVLCTSFDDYRRWFGGYAPASNVSLALCVQAYFANGGGRLYVVRIAAYGDASNRASCRAKAATASLRPADSNGHVTFTAMYPGARGNELRVDVRPGADGGDVGVEIFVGQQRVESWRNLSLAALPQFIKQASQFIRVESEGVLEAMSGTHSVLLTGGEDGPQAQDADFVGDAGARTGMHALDRVLDLSILLVPDAGPEAQRQALAYCQNVRRGNVIALLDVPRGLDAQAAAQYMASERLADSSENGAMYWPHIRVPNPAPNHLQGADQAVPPTPFVAGILGRLAASGPGGIYLPPAGIEAGRLAWAVGLDHDDSIDEARRDLVFPARVNPISTGPGLPVYVDGSRTLKSTGLCPWVAQRRGLSFIERNMKARLEYLRHRPLDTALMSEAYREMTTFLMAQMGQGAFASKEPKKAFHIAVNQSPADAILQVSVGMAFAKPAEFVWLQVSIDVGGGLA